MIHIFSIFLCFILQGKPKCLETYLRSFIDEMKALIDNGIVINGHLIRIKIKCFTCDTPARAFLKGIT